MGTPSVKFKQPKQGNTLMYLHPLIVMVMFDMASWTFERGIDFVVTDTISTVKKDAKLHRVSDAHRTMRAFDLRSRSFSDSELTDFLEYFNTKYIDIAQISYSDGRPRLVVVHGEGYNRHMHIGLHSRFSINY